MGAILSAHECVHVLQSPMCDCMFLTPNLALERMAALVLPHNHPAVCKAFNTLGFLKYWNHRFDSMGGSNVVLNHGPCSGVYTRDGAGTKGTSWPRFAHSSFVHDTCVHKA